MKREKEKLIHDQELKRGGGGHQNWCSEKFHNKNKDMIPKKSTFRLQKLVKIYG